MIAIIEEPILPQQVLDSLKISASGSVVMHIGIVRPSSQGKRVVSIEYKAARSEGQQELSRIAAEIRASYEIEDIALCRRTGKLNLRDAILVPAVAAPDHKEAFKACEQAVERMRSMASVKEKETVE